MTQPPVPLLPTRHVFVYGTLRRGGRNDITRLQPPPHFVGMAQVAGRMYDLGAYPGLSLATGLEEGAPVLGEVYGITPALEFVLDAIEEVHPQASGEYAKRTLGVMVGGVVVPCIVYEITATRTAGKALIQSGDWFHRI